MTRNPAGSQRIFLTVLLALMAVWLSAGVGTWQNHGPNPGGFARLAAAPGSYQGVFAGLYRGGCLSAKKVGSALWWETWPNSLDNLNVNDVAAAIGDGQVVLWAATSSYLFRSFDKGQTWTTATPGMANFLCLGAAWSTESGGDSVLYVGDSAGQVHKTSDGGATWLDATGNLPDNPIHSITVEQKYPTHLCVGLYEGSIYQSYNSGGNWVQLRSGVGDGRVAAVEFLISLPGDELQDILAAYCQTTSGPHPGPGRAIYKTVDGGEHWVKVFDLGDVTCLTIDPEHNNVVYAGTRGLDGLATVYKSTNRGDTWVPCGTADFGEKVGASSLLVVPSTNPLPGVYVGTEDGSVIRSTDGGEHWSWEPRGLSNRTVRGLGAEEADFYRTYAATDLGEFFGSMSQGWTWGLYNVGVGDPLMGHQVWEIAIEPRAGTPILFAAVEGGQIKKSPNGGTGWLDCPLPDSSVNIRSVAFAPTHPRTVYAGGAQIWGGHSFFRTSDLGETWRQLPVTGFIQDIAVSNKSYQTVLLGVDGSTSPYEHGVWGTTDGGLTWPEALRALPGIEVRAVVYRPGSGSVAYAGTVTHGVYRTTDGGASWVALGLTGKTVECLAVNPQWPDQMLAGVPTEGVYRSVDGGLSWFSANLGLWDKDIREVLFHPLNPGRIFASSDGAGVFFRDVILDLNLDGIFNVLDVADMSAFLTARQHQVAAGPGSADLNHDGVENAVDLVLMYLTPFEAIAK